MTLALLLAAPPVLAQGWDTYSYEEGSGAGVCPVENVAEGRYWCFMISCAPDGGTLYLRVAFSDADVPEDNPVLTITVDGEDPVNRRLDPLETAQIHDYGIAIVPDRDADLIEALSAGRTATLILGRGEPHYSYEVSLRSSRKAIDELEKLCPK